MPRRAPRDARSKPSLGREVLLWIDGIELTTIALRRFDSNQANRSGGQLPSYKLASHRASRRKHLPSNPSGPQGKAKQHFLSSQSPSPLRGEGLGHVRRSSGE